MNRPMKKPPRHRDPQTPKQGRGFSRELSFGKLSVLYEDDAVIALVRQFLEHTPIRQYLAVVRGHLKSDLKDNDGTLVHHFRQEGMFQKLTRPRDPKATRAELRYSVERPLRGASLVRVSLVTGLQNQIRVQLSALGHPVIGDRKYHPEEASERRITRVALHAAHLEFAHPRTGQIVSIDCPPPADFQSLLQALKFR